MIILFTHTQFIVLQIYKMCMNIIYQVDKHLKNLFSYFKVI